MFQIILLTNTRRYCVRWCNAGCSRQRQAAVEPAAFPTLDAAGSLVLRRMDRGRPAPAGLDSTQEWPQNRRAVDTAKKTECQGGHVSGRRIILASCLITGPAPAGPFSCARIALPSRHALPDHAQRRRRARRRGRLPAPRARDLGARHGRRRQGARPRPPRDQGAGQGGAHHGQGRSVAGAACGEDVAPANSVDADL